MHGIYFNLEPAGLACLELQASSVQLDISRAQHQPFPNIETAEAALRAFS